MAADPKKKPAPSGAPAFRIPAKGGMSHFSGKGVKKPVRATYYGKKAR